MLRFVVTGALVMSLTGLAFGAEPQWVEIRSPHFTVVTDAGEKRGEEVALRFEQMRVLFGEFLERSNVTLPMPLQIVALRNSQEMREFVPLWQGKPTAQLGGFFESGIGCAFIVLDMSAPSPWQMVDHEYAHFLLSGNTSAQLQPWFDEGFAEYFSSVRVTAKEADVGMVLDNNLYLLRQNICRMTGSCNNNWLSAADLFRVPHDSSIYNEATEHRSMFYAESWLAVHYIYDRKLLPNTFSYFSLVSQGMAVEDAIHQTFGMSALALDAELRNYLKEGRFLYAKMATPAGMDSAKYTVKPMASLDADAVMADVHLYTRDDQQKAIEEFEAVLKKQPGNASALRGLGYACLTKRDFQCAEEHFNQASEQDSNDPRTLYYSALLVKLEKGARLGDDKVGLARIQKQLQKTVELEPEFADAHGLLALTYAAQGNLEQALAETKRAVALSPRNDEYVLNLARFYRENGSYNLAINLLNHLVEVDPKSKTAWNDLGMTYLDSRQDDLAISSFQKQIEVNPHHEYAYNNLGRVYLRQRKYEEAIKWFSKQIEIVPRDRYAHTNLGLVYLEQHKYAEAVPELEQAASMPPENAEAQVRLGSAYLNLGQDEKAMATFDKALKISASPLIWNNIAYQLALKRAHLDVARQYSELAVTTNAAAMRNLSFEQLNTGNVGSTASQENYWDTLGWVEFADDNLDKAEKYILAAWQLGQHSEVADHLGQLAEKRGEKDRAVHFYALALSARQPEPAIRSRLDALAGGNDKADVIVEKSREELTALRTFKVANSSKQEGKAEFFLLLASGQGSEASVEDVKFISGDERLKVYADALRAARYGQTVPDDIAVKLLRRGTLSCAAAADCTFSLALPEDVKSVN
jgi:tetratricopeptide (TPR) repeat protein